MQNPLLPALQPENQKKPKKAAPRKPSMCNSRLWHLYKLDELPSDSERTALAICNRCRRGISQVQSSTLAMQEHLKRIHPEIFKDFQIMVKKLNDEKVMHSNNLNSKIYKLRNSKQGHGAKEIRRHQNIHLGIINSKECITV